MATKRIVKSTIDWRALKERVPAHQQLQFMSFKDKHNKYIKKMMKVPQDSPKIHWAMYQRQISTAGLVDSFQKAYEALQIPYPQVPDSIKKEIDDQEKAVKIEIADFKKSSNSRIKDYQAQLKTLHSLVPYDQMTMEDFKDAHPDVAIDPLNKPTFWPHNIEEQTDFTDKGHPLYGTKPLHE